MIRCIIIEDQPPAQRVLKKYISDVGTMELKGTFADALQAMAFLKTSDIDLILLDIHLPKISGIDFLKMLSVKPHVILTTAFPDYALESYEYDVTDYLLKPFSFERFLQAVSKVETASSKKPKIPKPTDLNAKLNVIFIKSGYELIKINTSEILYIHSDADYTEVFTIGKKLLSQEPLRFWEDTLDDRVFIRIHRSYLINISKIEKIVGNQVRLDSQTSLPLGRAYKERFMQRVLNK